MQRRDFLKSVPPVILMPQLRSLPRLKITDIRIVNLKTVRETGKMEFDALGLEAVRRAIELWREQLKMSTVGELSAAADVVHREFYRKEAA